MNGAQIGELIGVVVAVGTALAGYLNSRTAKSTANHAAKALAGHLATADESNEKSAS